MEGIIRYFKATQRADLLSPDAEDSGFLHTLLYLCISHKYSDLSPWLKSSPKQDVSYQLALQSVLEFILNIFLLSMWKKKKERNKYKFSFNAVFCTLVVFENVLIFENNQNKMMASLYPLGVYCW